jgi:hypothetical protein
VSRGPQTLTADSEPRIPKPEPRTLNPNPDTLQRAAERVGQGLDVGGGGREGGGGRGWREQQQHGCGGGCAALLSASSRRLARIGQGGGGCGVPKGEGAARRREARAREPYADGLRRPQYPGDDRRQGCEPGCGPDALHTHPTPDTRHPTPDTRHPTPCNTMQYPASPCNLHPMPRVPSGNRCGAMRCGMQCCHRRRCSAAVVEGTSLGPKTPSTQPSTRNPPR